MLVDTRGLLMHAMVHAADVRDHGGGVLVMATPFGLCPFLLKLYAGGGCQGTAFQAVVRRACHDVEVEIVKRPDKARGFTPLPRCWVIERAIASYNHGRVASKDRERLTRKALAFLHRASIRLMLRKLCERSEQSRTDPRDDPGPADR